MTMDQLAILHKRVIHIAWHTVSETDVILEDIWVKKYPYDLLNNVCVDCFSDPDSYDDSPIPSENKQ